MSPTSRWLAASRGCRARAFARDVENGCPFWTFASPETSGPPLLSAKALAPQAIFSRIWLRGVRASECEWRRALRGGRPPQVPNRAGRPSPRPLELSLTTDAPILLRVRRWQHWCRGSRFGRKRSCAQTFADGHAYTSHDVFFRLRSRNAPLSPAAALCLRCSRCVARRGGRYLPTFLASARLVRLDAASASAGVRWIRLRGSDASHATSRDLKGSPSCFTHHRQQRHLNVRLTQLEAQNSGLRRRRRRQEPAVAPPAPLNEHTGCRAHDPIRVYPICIVQNRDVLSLARFTWFHSEPLLTHSQSSRGGKPACAAAPRAVVRAHG